MANRIVSEKEFRSAFRSEAIGMADFSQKKNKHVLGIGPRQVSVSVGAQIVKALIDRFAADGRTLDKDMVHVMNPKGARAYSSLQFNQIGKMKLVHGANAIETVWKSLGDLIPVARKGVTNVYVSKNGATDMELAAMRDLRTGKLNARVLANEQLVEAIDEARSVLDGRNLGEMYAASCTEYFHTLPLEAAE
jgi:hypothetical protein